MKERRAAEASAASCPLNMKADELQLELEKERQAAETRAATCPLNMKDLLRLLLAQEDGLQVKVEVNVNANLIQDISPLAETLRVNSSLTSLILWKNRIEDERELNYSVVVVGGLTDASTLASWIPKVKSLTEIDLEGNRIQDASTLASWIPKVKSLTEIDLEGNRIQDIGPLAEALRVNSSLTNVNVWDNVIEDIGPLAEALRVNSNLTDLNVWNNVIEDIGLLAEALHVNSSLTDLNLWDNLIEDADTRKLRRIWEEKGRDGRKLDLESQRRV